MNRDTGVGQLDEILALRNKVAVVTGGASGIGRRTAELFAAFGAQVVVADLDLDKARETVAGFSGPSLAVRLDVADSDSCKEAVAEVNRRLGSVAVLANCAGVWTPGNFLDSRRVDWARDIDVNLYGAMNVVQSCLNDLIKTQGAIVNVASDAGRSGEAGLAAYSAAKGGVIAFSKALAKEIAQQGVRVNCISPSAVRTPATETGLDRMKDSTMRRMYPLGRLGEPDDVSGAILFLASSMSSWVTGQVLSVNGGYYIP